MKVKKKFIMGGAFILLFILCIVLIKTVDVDSIGPDGSSIGFAGINKMVKESFGYNENWYKITEYLGYFALLAAGCVALFGLIQLIRRKSLFKVDANIWITGGLYVVVIGLYVFFNKVAVNYRPMILPDETELEASFPSSHTMLTCVVMGSIMLLLPRYVKNVSVRWASWLFLSVIGLITVVGRLISGAHWLTDILAGVIISVGLVTIYSALLDKFGSFPVEG